MERLDAADSWYLYLETPTVHLHVVGVVVIDPTTAPGGSLSFRQLRRHVARRFHQIASLRRRLVEVPLGIDHPVWIEDPDFDLDDHLHHHVLSRPGEDHLAEWVGRFCSQQLDRAKPLWDMVYVEGVAPDRAALVTKMHHTIVDGISGLSVMSALLDLEPEPGYPEPEIDWRPDPVPSPVESAIDATVDRLRDPLRPLRAMVRTGRSAMGITRAGVEARLGGGERAAGPLNAPRTPFNATLTSRRSVAFGTASLADIKAVKNAFGVTVNDVVLAACTHGLRSYLERCGSLPARPLVCSVPVSVHRRPGEEDHGHEAHAAATNRVSNMFVHLPVHLDDPVDQLRAVHAGASSAKQVQDVLDPGTIGDVVDLIPPPLFHLGASAWSRLGVSDRVPPVHNLIVSNVRGAPVPLYLAGARVIGLYPFGPLMEGTALNVTVLSIEDEMCIGLISCPELVPDLEHVLEGILDGVDVLLARAEATEGVVDLSTGEPSPRRRGRDRGTR